MPGATAFLLGVVLTAITAFTGVAAAAAPAPLGAAKGRAGNAPVEALMRAWSGLRDSSETVTVAEAPLPDDQRERRISTVVEPVQLPWLGSYVLYLEETVYDEPDVPRRQLLVQLEPAGGSLVRARLFTFADPARWTQLDRRPQRVARLQREDVQSFAGCDLFFMPVTPSPTSKGSQFRGSTRGRQCLASPGAAAAAGPQPQPVPGTHTDKADKDLRYVDYQLLLDTSVYWYRRRVRRVSDSKIIEEVVGFNWFELDEARLFTCRIDWSATGHPRDLKPLIKMDLHDKGGRGAFVTPDGRQLLLTLHSQDWPFAAEHDSLVLLLSEPGASGALASSWTVVDDTAISLGLSWLEVRCGAIGPRPDEVRG